MTELTFEQLCDLFSYSPKGRPLDSKEVADLLQMHPNSVEQLRLRGAGPRFFSPTGTRRVFYSERDVLAWVASGERFSTSQAAAA